MERGPPIPEEETKDSGETEIHEFRDKWRRKDESWNEKTRVSFRLRAQEPYAITGNPED